MCGPSDNEVTLGPGNAGAITERPDLLSLARDLSGRGVTTDVSNAYIHAVRSGDKSRVAQLRKHVYGLHRIDRGVEHPPSPADFMVNHLDFDFAEMREDGDWDLHRWEGPPDGSGNSTSFVVGHRPRAYKATLVHDDDPELDELCDHPHCLEAACDLCTVCDMIYCAKHAAEDTGGMICKRCWPGYTPTPEHFSSSREDEDEDENEDGDESDGLTTVGSIGGGSSWGSPTRRSGSS